MKTYTERQQRTLIGYYHKLCADLGMTADDRRAMLHRAYGVESSADLDNHQLTDLIYTLERRANPGVKKRDTLRKRAIAAIGGWLAQEGRALADRNANLAYIKQIACRSTGYGAFNSIPDERLRNLYNMFLNKQRDKQSVEQVKTVELPQQVELYKMLNGGIIAEA